MRNEEPRTSPRWSRAQRFESSPRGRKLAAAYRSGVAGTGGVRGAFEQARERWATSFDLRPDDALYLLEVSQKPSTLRELGEALAICSQSRDDVYESMQRLCDAGLVTAVLR